MDRRKEIIQLDVRVLSMIDNATFRGELSNGHSIVAFTRTGDKGLVRELKVGDIVPVEMSPFNMSVGRIRWCKE